MLNADVARYRVDDMVRAGAQRRATKLSDARRSNARGLKRRAVISAAIALLPLPIHS